jgi:4-alpha-glucanotransferase
MAVAGRQQGLERSAGILLHPTSLPAFGGIGTLGPNAYAFAADLAAAGMRIWQVLPLGPTGYGDAPYSTLSAFAGNPYLIAFEPLLENGLLEPSDLSPLEGLPETHVDFGRVVVQKMAVLRRAFERSRERPRQYVDSAYDTFWADTASWLADFTLFMAIKDAHGGAPWKDWEPPLRRREPAALGEARRTLATEIAFHEFVQIEFFRQWARLKAHVDGLGLQIVGDIPIFVAHDSADVWANQDLFQLDDAGDPTVVAGVPPDYFSPTGQLWGNPHYRWDVVAERGFVWWIERFSTLLKLVDVIRLDHFRGFAGAWEVPFGEDTAINGRWVAGPGAALFTAIRAALGDVPIIAEDLGVITPDVEKLRDDFGFPGMVILQFAFGTDADNPSLPHNLRANTVAYTGTHDNDTTVGWYASVTEDERARVRAYLGTLGFDVSWELMRAAFSSVALLAVVPLQDVLRLGPSARMNLPGRAAGNWSWRFTQGAITEEHVRNLRALAEIYGRTQPAGPPQASVGALDREREHAENGCN